MLLMISYLFSVIVRDFNVGRSSGGPGEADPPLIVDSHAVLSRPIAAQSLEPIPGRHSQIVELLCRIDDQQLPIRYSLQIRAEPPNTLTPPDPLRIRIRERLDHQRKHNAKR
jgi:hypothetical protein